MMNNMVKKDLTQDIGSRMSGNFVCIRDTLTIREAMSELVRQAGVHDNIATLYVVDAGGVYAGAIDLKDLIIARETIDWRTSSAAAIPAFSPMSGRRTARSASRTTRRTPCRC